MLNLKEESRPKIIETGECWFCKQSKPLTETMYVPFSFLTAVITRDYESGNTLKEWQCDQSLVPKDFLMEKSAETLTRKFRIFDQNTLPDYEIQKKWKYNLVNVPRCEDCYKTHRKYPLFFKIIKAFLFVAFAVGIGIFLLIAYDMNIFYLGIFFSALLSLSFFLFIKVIGDNAYKLFKFLMNKFSFNTERGCRTYPQIVELQQKGWKLGANPNAELIEDSI